MTATLAETLETGRRRLGPEARLDAELLLAHLLRRPRSHLRAWPEQRLDATLRQRYLELIERRAGGEPLAYLTGTRHFWTLELKVTPATLIPRPDTETLVEAALAAIPPDAEWRIADLGTGSGAITPALANERPRCHVDATDISPEALEVARENARRHRIENVAFHHGSWFEPLTGRGPYHLIASNPPYVDEDDPHLLEEGLPFEPRAALTPGADALADLRAIVRTAPAHLAKGGWLMVEHGYDQGAEVRRLLRESGFTEVATRCDLGGNERVGLGRLSSPSQAGI